MNHWRLSLSLLASALLVGAAFPPSGAAQDAVPPPTAEVIWRTMVARYAGLSTYRDRGEVLSYWPDRLDDPNRIIFRTRFVRPGRFRFDWRSHHPYRPLRHLTKDWVVWSNAEGTFFYWSVTKTVETEPSLDLAVAGAAGVSRSSAHVVPRLLMPDEISGSSLAEATSVSLVGEEDFEGVACYRLRYASRSGSLQEAWVGCEDFLLHRREEMLGDTRIVEIRRAIQTDKPIADKVFYFEPPAETTPP